MVSLGLAVPVSSLASILINPLIGAASDRLGRRWVMVACLFISLFGFLLPLLGFSSRCFLLILLGRALTGAASSSQPIAQAAVIDLCSKEEKAFYLGLMSCAMVFAMVLGPLLGAILLDSFGAQSPYWFASGLVLFSICLACLFLKETAPRQRDVLQGSSGFLNVFKAPVIRRPMFLFLLTQFSWSLYFLAAPLQLSGKYGGSMSHAHLFLAWAGLWMALGFLVLYQQILKIWSLEKILCLSLFASSGGLFLCLLSSSEWVWWFLMIPVAMGAGFCCPSLLAIMSNTVPEHERGYVMGSASAMMALAWLLSGFLFLPALHVWLMLPMFLSAVLYLFGFVITALRQDR